MKENAEIEVTVETTLSELQKVEIEKQLKNQYGDQTLVRVKSKKIKNIDFENSRNAVKNNDLRNHYEEYLNINYPNINFADFLDLDSEISKLTPNQNEEAKRFKLKWLRGKNILSFNDVFLELENRGILRIHSEPQNMGGKSNLIRVLKILLFGEFYRSNQERSTLNSIMNKFSPMNTAMLEGEIEIENKNYLIRRDFTRNANNKVSQKITISSDGQIIDLAIFKKLIGDIQQFLFISFFDSFNVEKWLNTKPTERYRMFLNYFGLNSIEDKVKIAKIQYDTFLKNSIVKQYANINVENEILLREGEILNLEKNITKINSLLNDLIVDIADKESDVKRLQNQIKGVPDTLFGETPETLAQQSVDLTNKIETLKKQSLQLKSQIIEKIENKEDLINEINNLQIDSTKVKADSELLLELERLTYLLNNYIVNDSLIEEKRNIEKLIETLRTDYANKQAIRKAKESDLLLQPDSIICPKCNCVTDNKPIKNKIKKEIESLGLELEQIKQEGINAKNLFLQCENKIKAGEFDYKKQYNQLIGETTLKIENQKKEQVENIRSQIFEKQKKLQIISNNEKYTVETKILDSEIAVCGEQLKQVREKEKFLTNYENEIEFNEKIKKEIALIESAVQISNNLKTDYIVEIKLCEKQIEGRKQEIANFKNNAHRITVELKKDQLFKTYIEVHSKGGLAMKILNDLTDDINADLTIILSEEDFIPFVKIEEDAIEFCFYRDGAEFNMSEGSGYEKTILLLTLHYLLLSKMSIPISNIFILDEVFVGVSAPFFHRAYKVVQNLQNIFESILLITHIQEVSEWCDDSIKIVKPNNISKII